MSSITWRSRTPVGDPPVVCSERATVRARQQEVPLFRDAPGLFTTDGVPADLVRAGEPRLRTYAGRDSQALQKAPASRRVPLLRRMLRPVTP
jgi:hypothetical protein